MNLFLLFILINLSYAQETLVDSNKKSRPENNKNEFIQKVQQKKPGALAERMQSEMEVSLKKRK